MPDLDNHNDVPDSMGLPHEADENTASFMEPIRPRFLPSRCWCHSTGARYFATAIHLENRGCAFLAVAPNLDLSCVHMAFEDAVTAATLPKDPTLQKILTTVARMDMPKASPD